ncbi:MAG TPA: hypothetical protein EYN91_20595, partial [Candidatus Melainabacteria bacterium]|nr:hypothetical protein [Candidatus Melainabacteria bacterium]
IKMKRDRRNWSVEQKRNLLFDAGDPPRCWICGAKFHKQSVECYLSPGCEGDIPLPHQVDIMTPKGLYQDDLKIQIDHAIPFSRGGTEENDNLRLACGWCNRYKSSHTNLYDVGGITIAGNQEIPEVSSLPKPFWSVRFMVVYGKCQFQGAEGCDKSVKSEEIRIAPINTNGAMNPRNLQLTCPEHDPIRSSRLQSLRRARKVWGKKA